MTAELLRWRAQQSRYFADPDAPPPPEVLAAIAVDVAPRRSRVTVCYNCFREGHEAYACSSAGVPCTSCGGSGHLAEECPMYLMELSIRGSLTAYVEQRREQFAQVAADKGKYPALHSDRDIQGGERHSDFVSNSRKGKTKAKHNGTFSAIQCVICGKSGHANCGPPPSTSGAAYCPRCAQMTASDPWKQAAQRGRAQGATGVHKQQPFSGRPQHQKFKPSWKKHRKASISKAAAADPWHPSHLR